ncbi:MAG: hypothetical protein JWM05_1385 [Acidimicrobiales bacterium]|nr:hypothetical protein [Acidimicrobiales bacterium]
MAGTFFGLAIACATLVGFAPEARATPQSMWCDYQTQTCGGPCFQYNEGFGGTIGSCYFD